MTNTERNAKYNTIAAYFTTGAQVSISTVEGSEEGIVDFVGWDHYMDAPFVAVRIESGRFGWSLARMSAGRVFKKAS